MGRISTVTSDTPTILSTMDGPLGDSFEGPSWDNWRTILKAAYGMPLADHELAFFREVAGDRDPPSKRVKELWVIGGRRGGKDSIASLIIAHAASLFNGKRRQIAGLTLPALRRGERATVFCFGKDRDQARIVLGYVRDYFTTIPALKRMLIRETRDGFELKNGVDVIVATNDFRGIRGRAVLCAVLDECSFYSDANAALPDTELYGALKPGILTLIDQAMLIGISTPHKKSGLLWDKYQESFGKNDDDCLVIKATSLQLNPTLPADFIEKQIAKDPELNRAEYLCEWRTDIASFVLSETVDAAIIKGRQVIAPHGQPCVAFVDVSGGVHDSHACAVAFKDTLSDVAVLACARELKSPDTEAVVAEFAALLKSYGVNSAFSDRYGAQWVQDAFARHGISLRQSPHDRSALYLNLLPALNAGQVKLLDLPRLRSQLLALERRTVRGSGRDIVDHPTGGGDDLINAAAGALVLAASAENRKTHFSAAAGSANLDTKTGRRDVRYPCLDDVQSAFGSVVYDGGPNREWQPLIKRLPSNKDYLTDGGCDKPST
jgi:hypothetical protein